MRSLRKEEERKKGGLDRSTSGSARPIVIFVIEGKRNGPKTTTVNSAG